MGTPDYIKRAQNTYNAKFDLVQLKLPKGTKERIKALIGENGSISTYCVRCVLDALENVGAARNPDASAPDTEPKNAAEKEFTVEEVQAMLEARRAQNEEKKRQAAYDPNDVEAAEKRHSQDCQLQQKQTDDLLEKMRTVAQLSKENRETEEK